MIDNLGDNLYSKHKLSFNEKGKFKMLMLSDIQESANYNEKSFRSVDSLIDVEKPDLVILGGDNCYGPHIRSIQDFEKFLSVFSQPMEKRKIPWAHVFGNHDHDLRFDIYYQQSLYERYEHCISKHTTGIHGVTNFMLPVLKHNSDEIGFNIWCLDTNNHMEDLNEFVKSGDICHEALLPNMPVGRGEWDIIRFDQLIWYWNSSIELEKYCGRKIPSMLCMHIAPYEFLIAAENPGECGVIGSSVETLSPGIFNSGIFAEILQRGDVQCICCGHTHRNSFEATYCGIKLCYAACAGFTHYGDDTIRGGRVFEIGQDDPWNIKTRMIHSLDYMNTAPSIKFI